MSDVTVAPDGGGAPQAAPTNEVVINQNPTNSPQPVGSQAPDKPTSRADGISAAVQRAFDRSNNPVKTDRPKPAPAEPPKAAEAKPGHNNPPEPTEKIDLRRRPDAQPQPRGERGQFAPREQSAANGATPPNGRQQPGQPGQQQRAPHKQLPANAPYREAPPRFSEGGKADWADTSENVRADIHRMHSEFGKAYQAYRADHEAMNPIRHYHQMALQHGTTLDRALNNYVTMEQKLRQDPIGGLDVIVHNLNLQTPDGRRLGLRDIAYAVLSQTPDQLRMMQQGNVQNATSHQLGALHQELAGLKNQMQRMHTQQQFVYTRSAVDQFADQHPRFDELGDLIHAELQYGFDLPTAYRRAELLRPATQAAQTRTASAQTRPPDRSISGAPDAGPSNGTSRRTDGKAARSTRDAVEHAMKRVSSAL